MATPRSNLAKRIMTLRKKLDELGRRGSTACFLSPLSSDELAAFEETIGASLPESYRAVLLELTRGEEDTGSAWLMAPDAALATLTDDARPAARFPWSEAETEALRERLAKRKKTERVAALQGPWHGMLPLVDHGDADFDCIVLDGPERGRMWKSWNDGFTPVHVFRKGAAPPVDFLEWLEGHIADLLEDAPPPISDNARDIRLIGHRMTSIPSSVFAATRAQVLALTTNELTSLPDAIARLTELRVLALAHNRLRSLPEAIGALTELRELSAGYNALASLPSSLGRLSRLEKLLVAHNGLTAIPESIFGLEKLEELAIHDNALETLPDDERGLPSLRHVTLCGNPLRRLPEWLARTCVEDLDLGALPNLDTEQALGVLANLASLRTLQLGVHDRFPRALGRMKQLRWLKLIGLGLRSIPVEVLELSNLETLSLDQNELRTLEEDVLNMPNLRCIVLFSNPIDRREVERLRERHPTITFEHA